jgi:hypothetical protein
LLLEHHPIPDNSWILPSALPEQHNINCQRSTHKDESVEPHISSAFLQPVAAQSCKPSPSHFVLVQQQNYGVSFRAANEET